VPFQRSVSGRTPPDLVPYAPLAMQKESDVQVTPPNPANWVQPGGFGLA
jgi:hypothetical protein